VDADPNDELGQWLSVPQLVKRTSLSASYWYTRVYNGELPAKRVGKRILIAMDDAKAVIDAGEPVVPLESA
jgi:hypothetical protein